MPDHGRRDAGPSPAVRAAFGATGDLVPLAGGRGTSWRVGDVVLKPLDTDPDALSPYWRPPAYATAIVLVDALLYDGATADVLVPYRGDTDLPQYLLRALVFRRVAELLAPEVEAATRATAVDPYPAVADVVLRSAGG